MNLLPYNHALLNDGAYRALHNGMVGLTAAEVRAYSILSALRIIDDMRSAGRAWALPGIEGEAHRALETVLGPLQSACAIYVPVEIQRRDYRDLTANVASAAGYLVGSTTGGSYIEALNNQGILFRLGAQRLPGQRESLLVPRQSGSATPVWLPTEGTAATESQQVIQQLSSSPKTVSAYVELSRLLVKQSNPAAEGLVMRDLAAAVALALDAAGLKGTGASGQPTGILNTAGIGTFSGTTLGLAALSEAQEDVLEANAMLNPQTLGYATTPAVAKLIKNRPRFTGTDTPLWQGALHDGAIEAVRAVSTKQIPDDTMIYGDWSQVLIPEWGVLSLEINPYAQFKEGVIGVRAMWSCDVIVRHAESFTVATSIT